MAAGWVVNAALREAEFGNAVEAREQTALAMQLAPQSRYFRGAAALALARAGDTAQAEKIAGELAKEFPQDTILNFYMLPTVHGAIELNQRDLSKAVESLRAAQGYELAAPLGMPLGPIYLRGYAYLGMRQGKEAAAEFQKILDHRGIVVNSPIGALAHLGIGRALAASGDMAEARTAYQDYLALWKDADPDISILKQAKAEYARLQ